MKTSRRLVVGTVCAAAVLLAQGNSEAARVRVLNNEVLRLHGLLQRATPNEVAALRSQAAPVLEQRQALLRALIELDAGQALSLAFSSDLVGVLSGAFPQSAARLESHGVWQAPIEYYIIDDPTMTVRRSVRRMTVAQEQLEIYFGGPEPPGLKHGDILRVEGVRAGNRVAAANGSSQGPSVAAASCTTTGAQNIAVLIVQFPTVSLNTTKQTIQDIFFGNSATSSTDWSVDGFWKENSYGVTSAAGGVFGPYTLSQNYTCDQYTQMRAAAIAAADAEVYFPNYTRLVIVFPNPGSCGWAGLGTLGCGTLSSGDGSFTASSAWQLSGYMTTRNQGTKLSTHELGHNLSLHHASSRDFGAEALGPLDVSGTLSEYGDQFSTMGSWNLGYYSAQHMVQLNWLSAGANYQTVETSGAYSLQPLETNPPGLKALKVRRGTGNNAWLWVEYRRNIGLYDSTLNSQVYSGALIHYQDSTTGTRTHLLDFTPETSSWSDPALAAGKTWSDPYSNVSLTINSATVSALNVTVTYGTVPCTQANPTVTLSPPNPSVYTGGTTNYTVSVTNNDSSGCSSGGFTLSSSQPAGWGASFSPPSLTIAPGATATSTLTETVGTTTGTFPVSATATRGTFSGTGNANCTVVEPPPPITASVVTNASSYPPKSTVTMTATVMNGSPVSGASVKFTLTKPGGLTTTKTITTGSTGLDRSSPKSRDYFRI